MANIHLILDGSRGIYIPQNFAEEYESYKGTWEGVSAENIATLLEGPDAEWYWDAWTSLMDNATFTHNDGTVYHLYQDGDVWLIPDGWEDEEAEEFFGN